MSQKGAVGLTGGIACGKSEVAGFLKGLGIPVLDTDEVAHGLLVPGHWVYEKIIQVFGNEFVNQVEGGIDRRKLGKHVFQDKHALQQLNGIIHPEVIRVMDQWLANSLREHPYSIAMVPLLYETKVEDRFQKILVVATDEKIAMQRMLARGWSSDESISRLGAQMPLAGKLAKADAVIWNNDDLNMLKKVTIEVWNNLVSGKEKQS